MGFKALDWAGRRKVRGSGCKAGLSQTAAMNAGRSALRDAKLIGTVEIPRGHFAPPSPIKVMSRDFYRARGSAAGDVR